MQDMEKKQKMRRRWILILAVIFFGYMAAVTGYSVRHYYREILPAVEVTILTETEADGVVYDGLVPADALRPVDGGMLYSLYSLRQAEGPWGTQYFVTESQVAGSPAYSDTGNTEAVPIMCLEELDTVVTEVVRGSERLPAADPAAGLYQGLEVRFAAASPVPSVPGSCS